MPDTIRFTCLQQAGDAALAEYATNESTHVRLITDDGREYEGNLHVSPPPADNADYDKQPQQAHEVDRNDALDTLRSLCKAADEDAGYTTDLTVDFAEAFEMLDKMLSNGGVLPTAWSLACPQDDEAPER